MPGWLQATESVTKKEIPSLQKFIGRLGVNECRAVCGCNGEGHAHAGIYHDPSQLQNGS